MLLKCQVKSEVQKAADIYVFQDGAHILGHAQIRTGTMSTALSVSELHFRPVLLTLKS